ncbi:MAG: right-handed parallel beta-helix repeat-containing protein [Desulfobacterales bacterium]
MKAWIAALLAVIFVCFGNIPALRADTPVSGDIPDGSVWTPAGNPYIVSGIAYVRSGTSLSVSAGAEVRFGTGACLIVEGKLSAEGTENNPITFTSEQAEPGPGDWKQIKFSNADTDSFMRGCIVEYAAEGIYVYADAGRNSPLLFEDCVIRNTSRYGFRIASFTSGCSGTTVGADILRCRIENVSNSNGDACAVCYRADTSSYTGCFDDPTYGKVNGTLSQCSIQNCDSGIYMFSDYSGGGLNLYGSVCPTVTDTSVSNVKSDAVHMEGRSLYPSFAACHFHDNSGNGISINGTTAYPKVISTLITNNTGHGIYWNAGTSNRYSYQTAFFTNNTFYGNSGDGIHAEGSGAQWISAANNLLTDSGGCGFFSDGVSQPVISRNLYWNNTAGDVAGCDSGENNVSASPLFADAASGDFRLTADSPAIDAGTADNAPDTDRNAADRPQYSGIDMGAYEFPVIPGDADMNRKRNLADAIAVLRACTGMETAADKSADASGDSVIGLADAVFVMQHVAEMRE